MRGFRGGRSSRSRRGSRSRKQGVVVGPTMDEVEGRDLVMVEEELVEGVGWGREGGRGEIG